MVDQDAFVFQEFVSPIIRHEIHFVYEAEDMRLWGILMKGVDDVRIGIKIDFGVGGMELAGLGVEDVDQHPDFAEDMRLLGGEVGFCEGVLST